MIKDRPNKFIDTIYECCDTGVRKEVFHVSLEDDNMDGRIVTVKGQEVINFGSCSYLGIETDERLKKGAIDATHRFGTQYSSSRAYSACNLYDEAEYLLSKIFDGHPAVLAATTTLTHVGVMPVLLQEKDKIILDQKVHGSVQMATQLLKARGATVDMIRHNNMNMLEDKIKDNPNKYDQIWYMADGIYSMFGDFAPIEDIIQLLDKYENFYLYIDDAHGMSWTGKHGRGYVMDGRPLHPKIFLTTSLAKGFGVGGGVFVTTNEQMKRKIFTCGSSYTFSGPIQPPLLGAIVESAKIHLTDELDVLQNKLKEKIQYTSDIGKKLNLPEVQACGSPIFYYALGQPRAGYSMIKKLLNEGFYTNIGIFPTVPVNCTGLRIPITLNQTDEDIKNVLEAFAYHLPKVLEEEGLSIEHLSRSFKEDFSATKKQYPEVAEIKKTNKKFNIYHKTSIEEIDKDLWNSLLGDNGSFDWDGCNFIEKTFKDNPLPEDNWDMHYVIISDENNKPVLATFFSVLLSKDDMVASESISEKIEEKRKNDKYYMTSKVVSMGSHITEGNHLFLDKTNGTWKKAMIELLKLMNDVKYKEAANSIQIRDIDTNDEEMKEFLLDEGFIRFDLPDSHVVTNKDWNNEEDFIDSLSKRSRKHVRRHMQNNQELFKVEFISQSDSSIDDFYNLYQNIKRKSFRINTFDLPKSFFEKTLKDRNWELMTLRLRTNNALCCFVLSFKSSKNNYSPMVIGLDYDYNNEFSCYRQSLFQLVKRSVSLGINKIYFGMDASIEKQKIGAEISGNSIYLQLDDNFSIEKISQN